MHLAVSLRGNAQGVLSNLPVNDQRNYDNVCKTLQQRFAPTNQTELYELNFGRENRKQQSLYHNWDRIFEG
jgi:hypothetical protein